MIPKLIFVVDPQGCWHCLNIAVGKLLNLTEKSWSVQLKLMLVGFSPYYNIKVRCFCTFGLKRVNWGNSNMRLSVSHRFISQMSSHCHYQLLWEPMLHRRKKANTICKVLISLLVILQQSTSILSVKLQSLQKLHKHTFIYFILFFTFFYYIEMDNLYSC